MSLLAESFLRIVRHRRDHWLNGGLILIRWVLGVIFLLSGLAKFPNPHGFLITVFSFELVGPTSSLVAAILVPAAELVLGVCLTLGVLQRGAFRIAIVLSASFASVAVATIARGLVVPCGCFGGDSQEHVSAATLARSLAMVSLCLLWLIGDRRRAVCAQTDSRECINVLRKPPVDATGDSAKDATV